MEDLALQPAINCHCCSCLAISLGDHQPHPFRIHLPSRGVWQVHAVLRASRGRADAVALGRRRRLLHQPLLRRHRRAPEDRRAVELGPLLVMRSALRLLAGPRQYRRAPIRAEVRGGGRESHRGHLPAGQRLTRGLQQAEQEGVRGGMLDHADVNLLWHREGHCRRMDLVVRALHSRRCRNSAHTTGCRCRTGLLACHLGHQKRTGGRTSPGCCAHVELSGRSLLCCDPADLEGGRGGALEGRQGVLPDPGLQLSLRHG
mmetsp:Transcript_23374/g.66604  ORF Transcript_23374/g.66604 Transcript_23374/m.66604 type:complete len:259 (+) Transcript_23374:865-1641(+)